VTGAGLSFSSLALSSARRTLSSLNPWTVLYEASRVVLRMRLAGDTIKPHIIDRYGRERWTARCGFNGKS
jgi:hypothetical protein